MDASSERLSMIQRSFAPSPLGVKAVGIIGEKDGADSQFPVASKITVAEQVAVFPLISVTVSSTVLAPRSAEHVIVGTMVAVYVDLLPVRSPTVALETLISLTVKPVTAISKVKVTSKGALAFTSMGAKHHLRLYCTRVHGLN